MELTRTRVRNTLVCFGLAMALLGTSFSGPALANADDHPADTLVGVTNCCPNNLVSIDPATGQMATIGPVGGPTSGFSSASAL